MVYWSLVLYLKMPTANPRDKIYKMRELMLFMEFSVLLALLVRRTHPGQ